MKIKDTDKPDRALFSDRKKRVVEGQRTEP